MQRKYRTFTRLIYNKNGLHQRAGKGMKARALASSSSSALKSSPTTSPGCRLIAKCLIILSEDKYKRESSIAIGQAIPSSEPGASCCRVPTTHHHPRWSMETVCRLNGTLILPFLHCSGLGKTGKLFATLPSQHSPLIHCVR